MRSALNVSAISTGVEGENGGGEKPFTITTPLYYVSAAPHMGSAYTTIAADAISRFQRLSGKPTMFITGTDEHGEKIALAAERRGMSPQEHCDDIAATYKALWERLDIHYDSFIRTTRAQHEVLVNKILDKVWDNGDIYLAEYEGFYCVDCEEYKDEKELLEDKCCPTHRKPCSERKEANYFFKLSRYQKELEELIENTDFVQPESRRNEVLGWVKAGVRDFSISRAAVEWGIPISRDPKQTVYVWFDALNGYLSAMVPDGVEPGLAAVQASGWPADVHLIGKDILRFHAVYWPGMLLSMGMPLPKKVFGHGFLTKDGLKMGKALGNVLEPVSLVDAYGADAVRYFFLKEIELGRDGDFSEERFRNIVNANLANDIGNLLNRTLNLLKKNCDSETFHHSASISEDNPLRVIATEKVSIVASAYSALELSTACEEILAISSAGNLYINEEEPWTYLKRGNDEERTRAEEVLVAVMEAVRIVAVMLSPITPALSSRIYAQLGFSEEQFTAVRWEDAQWGCIPTAHRIRRPHPVFARLEGEFVTEGAPVAAK